ncbi:hypothetical protein HPP92_016378 [Vanilla planifolia]|uniref:Uncharacterized protein n=1 Tax=Vanilla planifolia TaxID=51239 RepID=A0A835QDZ3_VANPL|nr:hypothetical protein HPP92_016378 [Vanilla planifolia]
MAYGDQWSWGSPFDETKGEVRTKGTEGIKSNEGFGPLPRPFKALLLFGGYKNTLSNIVHSKSVRPKRSTNEPKLRQGENS